jgi:hypothetical protein
LSQIRKSYRNEPQNTTTHCTRELTVSESGEPKIWTIVQIFGLATMRALVFHAGVIRSLGWELV